MQLMTFNSLLMFDVVFVFFLFLVAVTCLVYYLPARKQYIPVPENVSKYQQDLQHRKNNYQSHGLKPPEHSQRISKKKPRRNGRCMRACDHHIILDDQLKYITPSCKDTLRCAQNGPLRKSHQTNDSLQLYCASCSFVKNEIFDDNNKRNFSESGKFNALSATFAEHFVVVDETGRALQTSPCSYVKAKFCDDKDCVGPVVDV